jgi:hypothetical protein
MNAISFWLAAAAIVPGADIAFLIMLRIGIAQQKNASSLASRPHALSASLARRLLALHACPPGRAGQGRDQAAERPHSPQPTRSGTP